MCYSGRDGCENGLVVVPRQVGIDRERVCRGWMGELSTKRSIMDKPRKKMQAIRNWNQSRWSLVAAFRDPGTLTNFGTSNRHRYPRKRPQAKEKKPRRGIVGSRSGAELSFAQSPSFDS